MKTALCLFGQPRTMDYCFPSLKQHVLDVYHPDVFICSDERGVTFKRLFRPVAMEIHSQDEIWELIGERRYRYTEHPAVTHPERDLSGYWKQKCCMELLRDYESAHGIYDLVFITRPDVKFLHVQPVELPDENAIYIPRINAYLSPPDSQGHHYGGYSAQLCWCSSRVAHILGEMYDSTDKHYKRYNFWHTESQLRWVLETNHIKPVRVDISMMIIRGTSDHPLSFDFKELESNYPEFK